MAWLGRLLCWLGFHDWEYEQRRALHLGARKGKGKSREVREWSIRNIRVGCYRCPHKPKVEPE